MRVRRNYPRLATRKTYRLRTILLNRNLQQRHRRPLTSAQQHVELSRRRHIRYLRRQFQQVIGRVPHRRHHHHHAKTRLVFRHHALRNRLDLRDRRHRTPPILLYNNRLYHFVFTLLFHATRAPLPAHMRHSSPPTSASLLASLWLAPRARHTLRAPPISAHASIRLR